MLQIERQPKLSSVMANEVEQPLRQRVLALRLFLWPFTILTIYQAGRFSEPLFRSAIGRCNSYFSDNPKIIWAPKRVRVITILRTLSQYHLLQLAKADLTLLL
jgi:hypothetical protein